MEPADFVELVARDEGAALAELRRNPALASARNQQGVSVVCLAVYRRRLELAAALAGARSDLDVFEAVCVGDLQRVVWTLSQDPARVNAVSPDGFSPVGYSAFFGHAAVLKELIRRGGNVEAASQNGMRVRPIQSAAAHSDQAQAVVLSRILLEAGADPNTQQVGGYTALHEAALNGNLALIDLLLQHGADPKIASEQGTLPVELARSKERDDAVRVLEAAVRGETSQ